MRITREDFDSGWTDIILGLRPEEIDRFIAMLDMLKMEPDQHFHLSSTFEDESRVSGIEISVQGVDEQDNAAISSQAMTPQE